MDGLIAAQEEDSLPLEDLTRPYIAPALHEDYEEPLADGLCDVLPDEIWCKVFSNLGPQDLLRVSHTCHRFRLLTDDDALWAKSGFLTCKTRQDNIDKMRKMKAENIAIRRRAQELAQQKRQKHARKRRFRCMRASFNTPWEVVTLLVALLQTVLVALKLDHRIDWPWLACLVPFFVTVVMLVVPAVSYFFFVAVWGHQDPADSHHAFFGGLVQWIGMSKTVEIVNRHRVSKVLFAVLGGLVALFTLLCAVRAASPTAMPASVVLLPLELAVLAAPVIRIVHDNDVNHYAWAIQRYSPLLPSAVVAAVCVLVGVQLDARAPMDWWVPTGVLLGGLVVLVAVALLRIRGTDALLSALVLSTLALLGALFVCLETPILNGTCDWPRAGSSFIVLYVAEAILIIGDLTCAQYIKYCCDS